MALTCEQKEKIIEDLRKKIEKQKAIVFVDFTGLKVKDLFNLRKRLKSVDNELKVVKKTLMEFAFKKESLQVEPEKLKGEIALVFGYKDQLSPAKITYQFSKDYPNLKILGGFFENKFREAEKIIELAQLPTREELLAKLVGSISAPVSNFVNVLRRDLRSLVLILSRLKGVKVANNQ